MTLGDVFGPRYLALLDRYADPERTRKDAEAIINNAPLSRRDSILDAGCGEGRLMRALGERGFQVRGVDASAWMVETAKRRCSGQAAEIDRFDFFEEPYRPQVDVIVSWDTSFGFESDEINLQILKSMRRSLLAGGRLVLNIAERRKALWGFQPTKRFHGPWFVMHQEQQFDARTKNLMTKWTYDDGGHPPVAFLTRLYSREEIADLLVEAGFLTVHFWPGLTASASLDAMCLTATLQTDRAHEAIAVQAR